MFNLNESNCFFLFISGVDLRKGFGRLVGIIRGDGRNPLEGDVFVFINRLRTTMKLLHWERGGYVIYHKRLECSRISHKVFVKNAVGLRRIRWDEMVLLIEGIAPSVRRKKDLTRAKKSHKH